VTTLEQLRRLFKYDESFLDPELARITRGFTPERPDWELAARNGVGDWLAQAATDIYVFPFLTPQWCELAIAYAEMVDAYRMEPTDYQYAAPEVRLFQLSPVFAEVFSQYLVRHVAPLVFHLWTVYPNVIHPPFITRYTQGPVRGIAAHHDNISDVTLSLALNRDFMGGGVVFERQRYSTAGHPPGTATLFPGKVTHRHRAEPITSGKRFVLTTWTQYEDR
jgi:hypothetical protein